MPQLIRRPVWEILRDALVIATLIGDLDSPRHRSTVGRRGVAISRAALAAPALTLLLHVRDVGTVERSLPAVTPLLLSFPLGILRAEAVVGRGPQHERHQHLLALDADWDAARLSLFTPVEFVMLGRVDPDIL
jgi:hypothetical protein